MQGKAGILRIKEPRCMQCGKQIRSMEKEYCYDCMHTHHYYEQGLSLWNHKAPVNQSIYQFKYHNQRRYGELYSQELVKNFQKEIRRWNPDVIIPVPLHRARRRKRVIIRHRFLQKTWEGCYAFRWTVKAWQEERRPVRRRNLDIMREKRT